MQEILPKTGSAKVYYKNLTKLLKELSSLHPLLDDVRYKNLLIQATEALSNLQKTDRDFDISALEVELKRYRALFTRKE